ncbi:hypothetical protein [Actinophytocola glycyrrhizae]|uniref:Uncharacterized protein n=1 Tax=Actinophytocola glycyrrhizae TaxID=2044873 RepID=A0ABV9S637_9PSEU
MRAWVPAGLAVLLLLAAPATASADVIFDPADADDLAATLKEATAKQDVCYGWSVRVSDPVAGTSTSEGSDRGAGIPVDTSSCSKYVELDVSITYTSESSELEDSASYSLDSSAGGPDKSDLDGLGLDWDSLTGEDPDIVIGNAVSALPLLAADKGMGEAIEASPAQGTAPADASLTDDPGSDFWRESGGAVLWGLALLVAGGVFAWWVFRTRPPKRESYVVPDTVPDYLAPPPYEPPTAPIAVQEPVTAPVPIPDPEPEPVADPAPQVREKLDEPPETDPPVEQDVPAESTPDRPAPSEEDVAPPGQKDKE